MRRKLLFFFGLTMTTALWGQFQGGSPYSAYGIGDLNWQGRGQQAGLAGAGIGLRSDATINLANPASYTGIKQPFTTLLETGFQIANRQLRTIEEQTFQIDGNLTDITLWLRPHAKWATVFGLQPFSKVSYSIFTSRFLDEIEANYQLINAGKGGLSRVFWGNAYALRPNLSLGFNTGLLFGSIEQQETFTSPSSLGNFIVTSQTTIRGAVLDGGLQWQIPVNAGKLTLGGVFQLESELTSRRESKLRQGANEIVESGRKEQGLYKVPLAYGLGWTYQRANWLLTGEGRYEEWSTLGITSDANWIDTWSGTLAMEIAPFKDKYQDGFQFFLLRAGFTYKNSYLEIDGNNFAHWLASAGMSIPISKRLNHLHINYSYQHRGVLDVQPIEEAEHRITVSVSLRDVWFLKRKFN